VIPVRPEVVNPRSGFIVNWNNKPAAGWPVGDQRELWGPLDRVQGLFDGIDAALATHQPFTADTVNDVMRHAATSDVFARRVVPFLASAVAALPQVAADRARLVEATELIEEWVADGAPLVAVGDKLPDPGAALYREFRTRVQRSTFADELGGALREMFYPQTNVGNQEDDHGSYGTPDALFYRALLGDAAAVPLSRDYFRNLQTGEAPGRDAVLVDALRDALEALAARFSTDDMTQWLEPRLLESYMDLGAVNVFFGTTTMERENRGSFNLLVDLGDVGGGRIIVPPGESGALPAGALATEPPHLRDQLALYEGFVYRHIPASRAEIEAPRSVKILDVPQVRDPTR
jgi:penicillin amidase